LLRARGQLKIFASRAFGVHAPFAIVQASKNLAKDGNRRVDGFLFLGPGSDPA